MAAYLWLFPVGLLVGAFGTLIGAGGGFLLMPLLLLVYPHEDPAIITSISLAVVFLNTASGSIAYARMRRIDYRAAGLFILATAPGAILGALTTAFLPRRVFDGILGAVMLVAALHLMRTPRGKGAAEEVAKPDSPTALRAGEAADDRVGSDAPTAAGEINARTRPAWHRRMKLGMLLSMVVGYVSNLLGIGGGIVHVPVLVRILEFPVHIATATSHLILAFNALAATGVHIATGSFQHGWHRATVLGIGVVIGAQIGAYWSSRMRGAWIIRGLALALGFVGIRVLFLAFSPHAV